jgi:solute carrier family 25 oxoglutarate transporter 11
VDLTKTQMQVIGKVDGVRPSPLAVAKRVVAENGIKGLYAGLSAALLRQAVYGTARLGLHRTFSNQLKGDNPTLSLGGKVAASMVRRGGMRWM